MMNYFNKDKKKAQQSHNHYHKERSEGREFDPHPGHVFFPQLLFCKLQYNRQRSSERNKNIITNYISRQF